MSLRWRLLVVLVQLGLLVVASQLVTGAPLSDETWFVSGLLAVVLGAQLLEPFFARPQDVLVNCFVALVLIFVSPRSLPVLWGILAAALVLGALLAVVAMVFGASRTGESGSVRLARTARLLSSYWTSRWIYSAVFWLSVLEVTSPTDNDFWILGVTWVLVLIVGVIPWDRVVAISRGRALPATIEAFAGPSRLLIAANAIPRVGSSVKLLIGEKEASGLVLRRTLRSGDVLGEVAVIDGDAELLARESSATITEVEPGPAVGVVEARSSDSELEFTSAKDLSIGEAIEVRGGGERGILYQVEAASIEDAQVHGGGRNLVVRARASQIGRLDSATGRIQDVRWAPPLNGVVSKVVDAPEVGATEGWLKLGSVIGSAIPVFLDLTAAFEGHLAILGMTRMGKTTLCLRLAHAVSAARRIVILDQTGEYVAKLGLPVADPAAMWDPGLKVHEKPAGPSGPEFALDFFKSAVDVAAAEYADGDPQLRAVFIEEAHQFVPEPAMLGFGDVRNAAIELGQLVMQIRKYGLATVLVSQRTAVVAKSALSQCENLIVFKSVDQTGLDYIEAIGGSAVRTIVPRLRQGQALVCGPAVSSERPVAVQVDI